ncbi:MAG: hypothetical protein EOP85_07235 [Verrucomicrobiaceae bacterium]|nr:MAG: hypothetical protein EOP85_07235 [Verrucomicrobiaceae bacterium]
MKFIADEVGTIDLVPGRDYAVLVVGDFGGGSLLLTLTDDDATGPLQIPGYEEIGEPTAFVFTAPCRRLGVALDGSTAPSLKVDIHPCATR